MKNPLKKATVIKTNKQVRVYELHEKDMWCNYDDMTIKYHKHELKIDTAISEEDI